MVQFVLGIINQAAETATIASAVNDSDGVYFVPAFSGLQVRRIFARNDYKVTLIKIGRNPKLFRNKFIENNVQL